MPTSPQSTALQLCRRKRIIPEFDSESDNYHTRSIVNNKAGRNCNISQLSSSWHVSSHDVNDSTIVISPAALRYANSFSFPPIIITGIPNFTPQSSPDIIQFLRFLDNSYPTLPEVCDISWRLNNKHYLLLFAPTRDLFSPLLTNNYPSSIGTSSTQVLLLRRSSTQLSLLR